MYLYKRSFARLLEIFYWPFLDLVVWGFITIYLEKVGMQVHGAVTFFLGALILWDVLFRAQQGIAVSFLEEMWARNLMNLFASPLTVGEYPAATMTMSVLKVTAVGGLMMLFAWVFYSYDILQMGLSLLPFVLNLVISGWIIGVLTTSIIMRFGQQAEVLAWGMVFLSNLSHVCFTRLRSFPLSCNPLPGWSLLRISLKGCVRSSPQEAHR
ncbi:MAG: hypothetical protein KIT39_04055 [Nitrospirales bacterium]|nr:hypothetical protein [Nitrospirales bacterium]